MKPEPLELTGADNNRLAADIRGTHGHPVILLHGGGQTRHAWAATAQRLAMAGMRAITVDMRGHGESEWVESGHYRFADFGRDAAALIRQVATMFHEAPSGVGASLGGLSFLAAEAEQGPLLEALVLVDIVPLMNMDGVARIRGFMRSKVDEGFGSLEEAADAIAAYLPHRKRPASLDGLKKNLRRCDDGRYRWHWDPAFYSGEYAVSRDGDSYMRRLDDALCGLHPPVLLVRGMNSELVDEETAREVASRIPRGQYTDVAGAGHMVAGDKNDVFCAAILEFLGGQPS
ncbi:MAG: alpha/beta hydrolase [Notoacmeibacter sp.]|nr:alpha/beta hydrolase [Notoacmeibacter sp.]